MTNDDQKTLRMELCRRWPKKFNKDDLDYWCEQMRGQNIEEVKTALTKFRNTSAFRPKPPEIFKIMPRRVGQEQQASAERSFADITREHLNISKDRSAVEVLMRYWRGVWWQYKTNSDNRRASMDLAAKVSAERESVPESEIRSRKAFSSMIEMWEAQAKGALDKCLSGCVAMLANEGLPINQARDYADWIEVTPDQFRGFLSDLRSSEVVDVFA